LNNWKETRQYVSNFEPTSFNQRGLSSQQCRERHTHHHLPLPPPPTTAAAAAASLLHSAAVSAAADLKPLLGLGIRSF
jgi:hypothetical protein